MHSDALNIFASGGDAIHFASRHGLESAEANLQENQNNLLEALRQKLRTDKFVAALRLLNRLHSSGSVTLMPIFTDILMACRRHMSIASIDWSDTMPPTTKKMEQLSNVISICGYSRSTSQQSVSEVCLKSYALLNYCTST